MPRFRSSTFLLVAILACPTRADESGPKYRLTDPELKTITIDASPNESFLSVKVDPNGRIFVGGREALFVYEPNDDGTYQPRRELFRFPKDSWIYDVEMRGNDLYVLTLSALYRFRDGVVRREGLQPERLIWGPPDWHVHQAFHGLAWGPEGDLYISMGDLLVWYGDFNRPDHFGHWTMFSQPAGTRTPYTGVGAIFRCRPDGSRLAVVAGGTRNSCGLVFDSHWNLFTNDNDHESLPTEYVPGRLLHVVPQADFAWPRGWLPGTTPDRADLLETIVPDLGRFVPVGQTYYDETYFPERYQNNLLVARWGRRTITRYPVVERGASFASEEHVLLEGFDTTRPVGLAVGRGGRLFATIAYMAHNEGSPVYPSELIMITRADDTADHPFERLDLVQATGEQLMAELGSGSSWRARRAHNELLRRGGDDLARAIHEIEKDTANAAKEHLLWLSAASRVSEDATRSATLVETLAAIAEADSAELSVAAVRVMAEYLANDEQAHAVFVRSLEHANPRVQLAALEGLFKTDRLDGKRVLPERLISGPASSADTYLRQISTMLLARRAPLVQLTELCKSEDERIRLAGVLAAGFRLTLPLPSNALAPNLPLQPWQNDEPYIVPYADETIDLRTLGRLGVFTTAEHWNAGPHSATQTLLAALLSDRLEDMSEPVRLQAAHFLSLLNDPAIEPRIENVRQRSERERLAHAPLAGITELWIAGPFDDGGLGLGKAHPPELGAVDLNGVYSSGKGEIRWQKLKAGNMFDFRSAFGNTDGASVYALFRLDSPRTQQAMLLPGSDDGLAVWLNGRLVSRNDVERGGLPLQDLIFLDLQAGSNDILLRVRNVSGEHNLYLHYRSLGGSAAWSLPERFDEQGLSQRLTMASGSVDAKVPADLADVDWIKAATEGDAERGRKLFSQDGIGCAKCHSVDNAAVQGGPSLADAGLRFTVPYLVESILLPSRQVNPLFRSTLITTNDGRTLTGFVLGETAENVELLTPEAQRLSLPKSSIDERTLRDLSPMPSGLIRTADELRDILAFLVSRGHANGR